MPAKRGRPWRRIRAAVLAAAPKPLRCHWCHELVHPLLATVDHVRPLAETGGLHLPPFVVACKRCNSRRAAERTNVLRRRREATGETEPRKVWPGAIDIR